MVYNNKNFPYDFDDANLEQQTQKYMQEALSKIDADKIVNIVHSAYAQMGLAEIHRRQNAKGNRNTRTIAICAIAVSITGIILQVLINWSKLKLMF